jgi:hypothetical protein
VRMPAHDDKPLRNTPFTIRRGGGPRPREANTSTYPYQVNGDLSDV